ncbi:hypothetical protein J6590_023302 [Homalodisca vitripennis]|nr:hypothetical protein J6590_023302 [Homalodisca vitripennis]
MKFRDHFWLVYTYQLNPPLGTAKTDVPLQSGQLYGMSSSGTSLTANVEILGFMGNSIGLLALNPSMCPRYYKEQNETVKLFNERDPEYKDIFDLMTLNTGANVTTCSQMYMVWEVLSSQLENDLPLPHWTKEIFPEKLLPIISRIYRIATIRNLKMVRLVNGLFIEYIMTMMNMKKNNTSPDVTMYVHVGHDVTLLALLTALGYQEAQILSSGTALIFELHLNPAMSSGWEVKVLKVVNNHEEPAQPALMDLPSCTHPCDFNVFLTNTAKYIPTNWARECEDLNSPSDIPNREFLGDRDLRYRDGTKIKLDFEGLQRLSAIFNLLP